jgi:hypothetical protein
MMKMYLTQAGQKTRQMPGTPGIQTDLPKQLICDFFGSGQIYSFISRA